MFFFANLFVLSELRDIREPQAVVAYFQHILLTDSVNQLSIKAEGRILLAAQLDYPQSGGGSAEVVFDNKMPKLIFRHVQNVFGVKVSVKYGFSLVMFWGFERFFLLRLLDIPNHLRCTGDFVRWWQILGNKIQKNHLHEVLVVDSLSGRVRFKGCLFFAVSVHQIAHEVVGIIVLKELLLNVGLIAANLPLIHRATVVGHIVDDSEQVEVAFRSAARTELPRR